jgi:cysteinyl-tRNA synthetase
MHNNMITVEGQKMGKSLNNFITLDEFFTGKHEKLDRAYSPMTIRFFILQAHYRSTVDFSNEALQAAEKGMKKLLETVKLIDHLQAAKTSSADVRKYEKLCTEAMDDDFNTPIVLAHLFELSKLINQVNDGIATLTAEDIAFVKTLYNTWLNGLLGLRDEKEEDDSQLVEYLMGTILELRAAAKRNKDYATADKIRDELAKLNIQVKDTKDGAKWGFK